MSIHLHPMIRLIRRSREIRKHDQSLLQGSCGCLHSLRRDEKRDIGCSGEMETGPRLESAAT